MLISLFMTLVIYALVSYTTSPLYFHYSLPLLAMTHSFTISLCRLWKRGNVSDRYFIVLRKKEKRKKSSDHQQQQQQHTLKQRPFSATGGAASSAAAAAASKMLVSKGTKSERGKKKYFD